MSDGAKKFDAAGTTYELELEGEDSAMVKTTDGADYAYISDMNINSVVGGVFLTPDFKEAAILAIEEGTESFEYTDGAGETIRILSLRRLVSTSFSVTRRRE